MGLIRAHLSPKPRNVEINELEAVVVGECANIRKLKAIAFRATVWDSVVKICFDYLRAPNALQCRL